MRPTGPSTQLQPVCFLPDGLSLVVGEYGSHKPYFWVTFDPWLQCTLGMTTLSLDIVLSLVSRPGWEIVTDWRTWTLLLFLKAPVVTMSSRVLCPSSLQVRHIPSRLHAATPTPPGEGGDNIVITKCFSVNSLRATSSQDSVPNLQHLE